MAFIDQIARQSASTSATLSTLIGAILLGAIYWVLTGGQQPVAGIPVVGTHKKEKSWLPWHPESSDFHHDARTVMQHGEHVKGGIFQVKAGSGYKVVLPNRFAHELRNHPDLAFDQAVENDFHTTLRGYEGFREATRRDGLMIDIVRMKLTQVLGLLTADLVEETDHAVKLWLAHKQDWTNVMLRPGVLDVVSRVSARIFGGTELARDEQWLEIAQNYTISSFQAAFKLHQWPKMIRPIVNLFFDDNAKNCSQVSGRRQTLGNAAGREASAGARRCDRQRRLSQDPSRCVLLDAGRGQWPPHQFRRDAAQFVYSCDTHYHGNDDASHQNALRASRSGRAASRGDGSSAEARRLGEDISLQDEAPRLIHQRVSAILANVNRLHEPSRHQAHHSIEWNHSPSRQLPPRPRQRNPKSRILLFSQGIRRLATRRNAPTSRPRK